MTDISTDKRVNDFLATEGRLVIGGQRRMALSGKTFDTPNPATGRRLATVAEGQAEDIDAAVKAPRAAFDGPWSSLTPSQRAKILWKIGDLIEEHAETLAEIESLDNGKPKLQAQAVDVAAPPRYFTTGQAGVPSWKATPFSCRHPMRPARSSTPTPCANPSVWSVRSSRGTSR